MNPQKGINKYRITCAVTDAHGIQTFTVYALSKGEAIAKHRRGESEFEAEEVEVISLGEPDVEEMEAQPRAELNPHHSG